MQEELHLHPPQSGLSRYKISKNYVLHASHDSMETPANLNYRTFITIAFSFRKTVMEMLLLFCSGTGQSQDSQVYQRATS